MRDVAKPRPSVVTHLLLDAHPELRRRIQNPPLSFPPWPRCCENPRRNKLSPVWGGLYSHPCDRYGTSLVLRPRRPFRLFPLSYDSGAEIPGLLRPPRPRPNRNLSGSPYSRRTLCSGRNQPRPAAWQHPFSLASEAVSPLWFRAVIRTDTAKLPGG